MKRKANEELSERDKLILDAIVSDYINSPEPVGSHRIFKKYNPNISTATIRSVSAELEDLGYLFQPHASSGRIPTDRGFRFYVDRLLQFRELTKSQKNRIEKEYDLNKLTMKELLEETSKVLSKTSRNVGLVLAPKLTASVFEHIEFVKLSRDTILVVFVTKTGVVYNKKIRITDQFTQRDLQRISNYLSDIIHGLNLSGIRRKILEEMEKEKIKCHNLFSRALAIFMETVESDDYHESLYIEGTLNIINDPVFRDISKIKEILSAFEDKRLLIKILDRSVFSDGIFICIGEENDSKELLNCSVISSNYGTDGNALGTLGVIGSTRMDYARIIPLVDYMSKLLSQFLKIMN